MHDAIYIAATQATVNIDLERRAATLSYALLKDATATIQRRLGSNDLRLVQLGVDAPAARQKAEDAQKWLKARALIGRFVKAIAQFRKDQKRYPTPSTN